MAMAAAVVVAAVAVLEVALEAAVVAGTAMAAEEAAARASCPSRMYPMLTGCLLEEEEVGWYHWMVDASMETARQYQRPWTD